ncbi:hypothetical protein [Miltoncostaea oceani]|uniref:hypothetical protein n=1 Tax=Miltoncostaea oceani TaxID=2843216 RepID=UPI001C3CDAFB|nr:hypothetical protein [Miltoncostaea oceani]
MYDPHIDLIESLALPISDGAEVELLHPLEELADLIADEPRCTVAISDVHGWHELLEGVLFRLGMIDENSERIPSSRTTTLIQVGDGIDGRHFATDLHTLRLILRVFDRYLVGNHELAYLRGGIRFDGQRQFHDLSLHLEKAGREGRLGVAHAEADVLFTHAGVDPRLLSLTRASSAAARLERLWARWLSTRLRQPRPLMGTEGLRGGGDPYGGVLWQGWRSLLDAPRTRYRQVVGHSPRGAVERDPKGRLYCFDTGGWRLGVAVCWPDGRLVFGSDVIPEGQEAASVISST